MTLRGPLVFCYSSSQVIAIRHRIFPHNSIEFCEVRIAWSYTYVQTHLHDHGVVLKQRINLEFLNFDMIKERLLQNGNETFSRAFANCEMRLLSSSCLSVRLIARNNSFPTGRMFMNFDIQLFFENSQRKFKFH